jgi:hypothetical protein
LTFASQVSLVRSRRGLLGTPKAGNCALWFRPLVSPSGFALWFRPLVRPLQLSLCMLSFPCRAFVAACFVRIAFACAAWWLIGRLSHALYTAATVSRAFSLYFEPARLLPLFFEIAAKPSTRQSNPIQPCRLPDQPSRTAATGMEIGSVLATVRPSGVSSKRRPQLKASAVQPPSPLHTRRT